ncbi:ribosome biogenesis GTPase YlqF [Alkalibacter mobilis]|uniref:ribosome biogenesis GTPase YlqF n=1 Tax=Alkalibacter mobilis TaxID=2787712 RepID=UPI00189D151C|nr:ribosome biogenesis GTPase YlqF [Alkalibacter mobilis]MBF7095825.1 ribosome biogenesis GTPase YlqF [Alkalibacter mobilis]
MDIQWYPGHMAKAKRQIRENLKLIDVVIELVDARIPISSSNPEVDDLINGKKKIVVLNKSDLADPEINKLWEKHYKKANQPYVFVDAISGKGLKELIATVKTTMKPVLDRDKAKGRLNRQIRCLILGIPNVGKSTLINSISGRASTKTGNKPGVTKANQWIKVSNEIQLLDTPGILWPKFDDETIGLKLAWIGSIKDTIYDREEAALKLLEFLRSAYPNVIYDRYKVEFDENTTALELMESIARKRNYVIRGGEIDYSRTAEMLMDEIKKTTLGKVSFEWPEVD